MNSFKTMLFAAGLTFSTLCFSTEMNGVYYCLGDASVGIDNGTPNIYQPTVKFTIKVDSKSGWLTISGTGSADDLYQLSGVNNSRSFASADGGVYKGLTLQGNIHGGFDYVWRNSRINLNTLLLEAVFIETGKCQKW